MTSAPKISVVMSTYNGEKELPASIESVLNQTMDDFEFIIVNDGSTDNSLEVLREFEKKDSRIRIIDQQNTGLTKALITGCDAAKANYIARQDVGDFSHPTRFQKQYDLIEKQSELGFVSCFADAYGPGNEFLMTITRSADIQEATDNLKNKKEGPPHHGTVIFRKSTYDSVGGYRSQFYYGQDADLWLRMSQVASVGFVPETLYSYRIDEKGISTSQRDWQKQFGEIGQSLNKIRLTGQSEASLLEKAQKLTDEILELRKSKVKPTKKSTFAINYFLGSLLAKQNDGNARKYLLKAITENPIHLKSWLLLMKSAFLKSKPVKNF